MGGAAVAKMWKASVTIVLFYSLQEIQNIQDDINWLQKVKRKNAISFPLTNIYAATSVFIKSMQMQLKVVYTPELVESIALTNLHFVHPILYGLNVSNVHISVKVIK